MRQNVDRNNSEYRHILRSGKTFYLLISSIFFSTTSEQLMQFSYLLLLKQIFLVYSFSEEVTVKGNSSKTIINVAASLLVHNQNGH